MVLTLWTDDPGVARAADQAGVDRIGPDLERLGKRERQADPGYWLSPHREESLPRVRASLRRGRLFVRTNPLHDGWDAEAERLIAAGAEVLMLPAFRSARDVEKALSVVGDRVLLVPLVETVEALHEVSKIAGLARVREVHFGLNDLALSFGLPNRFALLTHPAVERATILIAENGVRMGIGGIGRCCDTGLPIPSDLIYAQYPRLGATGALIARSFFRDLPPRSALLAKAVAAARERFEYWYRRDHAELLAARDGLDRCIAREGQAR